MNKTWLIIKREYFSRVKKRSFIIMSLLGPLIMAGVIVFSLWLSLEESENQKILVVDDSYPLFKDLEGGELIQYEVQPIELEQALERMNTSDYTAVLHIPGDVYKVKRGLLYFKKQPSFRIQRLMEENLQQYIEIFKLKEFDFTETDYRKLKAPISLVTMKYDGESGNAQETDMLPAIVGLVFSVLIYMFVFIYSVQVMRGVIEEKTSRIIEVIISSVKPFQLMLGKIIGVGGVGLTQFLIWIFLTIAIVITSQAVLIGDKYEASNITQTVSMTDEVREQLDQENAISLTELSKDDNLFNKIGRINFPLMISLFLFYFLGGFFLYSAMMAAVGSAVDNDTETQQFVLPITFPLLLSYIVAFSIFDNPSSPIAVWMSMIPFTSPVIMMIRVAFNSVTIWEIALSMSLLVITFIFMVWVSARVYRTGILMYGKKASLSEIIKWIRY